MSFLPIVERELRVAARRRGTYWLRFFLAFAVIVVWFFLLFAGSNSISTYQRAQMLFMAIGILALGFCLFAGVFLTADCVSEEKREGTLGLLFLTELKGYDVVLGKLIATSLHAFYGLVAILPVLALPMLMGGVTVGEFCRVTAVLAATLLFSLSIGLLVSSMNRDTRQAMAGTLLALLALGGVMPVLWWLQRLALNRSVADFLLWPSPGYLFTTAFDRFFRTRSGAIGFWSSLITILSLMGTALLLAALRLPRVWQEKGEARAAAGRGLAYLMRFGRGEFRAARRWWLSINPYYWLASRDRLGRWFTGGILAVLLPMWCCFLIGCFFRRINDESFAIAMFMAFGIHQVLKILIAVEATRRLSEDRHSGALELLLVTPLPVTQILYGQRRALLETFRLPMAAVLFTNVALIGLLVGNNPMRMSSDDAVVFVEMFVGGAVMLVADFFAMHWVGMWMALHTRRHHRAIFATLARVMLAPWIGILLFVFIGMSGGRIGRDEVLVLSVLWFLFSVALDAIVGVRAKVRLFQEFRLTPSAFDVKVTNPGFTAVPTVLQVGNSGALRSAAEGK
jgi:hypothetical protein